MSNWAFRQHNWQQDSANNIGITAVRHDQEDDNIYLMLNRAWDTQSSNGPQQSMNMANQKFINCAEAVNPNEFALLSQVQTGSYSYATDTGTTNTFVITLAPVLTSYTTGMVIRFIANNPVTGPSTINVNSLGAQAVLNNNISTVEGDILDEQLVTLVYNGTNFQIDSNLGGTLTQNGQAIYGIDAQSSGSYVLAMEPTLVAYQPGQMINFYANTANSGSCTLNIDSLGAKTIKKNKDQNLERGDIRAGQLLQVIYDGTNFQMLSETSGLVNQYGTAIYASATGSTNTYAVSLTPVPSAYVTGMTVRFMANSANTGTATLNVNSLGAKTIKKNATSNLSAGDIVANQAVEIIYDGTNFQLIGNINVTSIATSGLATGGTITGTGTITVTAATQANQIAGTSTTVAVVPAVQQYHPSSVKSWIQVSYSGSTPSIAGSYNVSSIVNGGTGVLSVTFTNPLATANYTITAGTNNAVFIQTTSQVSTGYSMSTANFAGSPANPSTMCMSTCAT